MRTIRLATVSPCTSAPTSCSANVGTPRRSPARFAHLLADWPQVRADYRAWSLDWDDPHANDDLFGHSGPCCSPRDLFYRLSRITSADDLATLDAICLLYTSDAADE